MYGCGRIAGTGCPLKLKNIYYIVYNDLRRMHVVYKLFKTVYVLQVLPMYTTRTISNTPISNYSINV